MKGSVASVAVLLLVGAASAPIAAQDYPSRPVRAITALVPGGLSDVFMRVAGEEFQKQLGQPIVVENRPGGSLNIGGRACAEAPPDGYTICILPVETLSYNKFLFKKLAFDPEKDFAPITNLFFVTQVLAVNAAMKVRSLDELAALSKAKPGTLSYVAPSVPLSLFMDKFKQSSGADMVKVPYRGGGDAVNGILSGATPIAFLGLANVISHLRGNDDGAGDRQRASLAAHSRCADAARARLSRRHHAGLFRARRARRHTRVDHRQAQPGVRAHRHHAGVPKQEHGRSRA